LSCAKSMSPNCQLRVPRATVPTLSIPFHIMDCLSALQTAQNKHLYRFPLPRLVLHLISYNNNNNFQLSIIPKKNKAIVLQSFIHIFGVTGGHFSKFVANSKK